MSVKTLIEWLGTGDEAVTLRVGECRALICVTCPLNRRGGVLNHFVPAFGKRILKQIELRNRMKLSTSVDPLLGLCEACHCWMPLKIWTPGHLILKHLKPKTRAKLDPSCWILKLTKPS